MSRTLLVTGATGFVGRHLVPALAAQGFRLRVALRQAAPDDAFAPDVERHVVGDIAGDIDWRPVLRGTDAVLHLAGLAHTGGGAAAEPLFDRINRGAAVRLASAAREAGARFVFMSSVRAQSGPTAAGTLSENTPPAPTDPYGRAKLAAEREIAALGGPFVILRPTLVYGTGVRGNMGLLVRLAARPVPLPFGAVRNARSLLAVDNLAAAVGLALTRDAALGGTFLVADGAPLSLAEIVTHLRDGMGRGGVGRGGMGRGGGLVAVPPGLVGAALALIGRGGTWQRLSGNLAVSTARLSGLGFVPPVDTATALRALGAASLKD